MKRLKCNSIHRLQPSTNIFKILSRHSHYCYAVNRGYHFCLPDEWLKLAVASCLRSWIKWLFAIDAWNVSIFCTSVFVSMSKYCFLSLTIKLKTFSRGEDYAASLFMSYRILIPVNLLTLIIILSFHMCLDSKYSVWSFPIFPFKN